MYERITGESPYEAPMRIFPAAHYTMGGLWVDYNLESNIPGLFVAGEANFSDHGANRLGASALMQGLADGYFVLPYTLGNYLARGKPEAIDSGHPGCVAVETEVKERIGRLLGGKGRHSADHFHRELGTIIRDHCGMARNAKGLQQAIGMVGELREQFWSDLRVPGSGEDCNVALETAGRVADFFELAELMCRDALDRDESCGAHFREEHQTDDGEAKRNDDGYSHASVWEFTGVGNQPNLYKEPLRFEYVKPATRSYK
jgi:succinate dehydrogenase / fumarate reductase flavoprotein subunit